TPRCRDGVFRCSHRRARRRSGCKFDATTKPAACSKLLIELLLRRRLVGADAASGDVGHVIVLAAHGSSGDAAKQCDLPDVPERIGDRALEELLLGTGDRTGPPQTLVEAFERVMEARALLFPRKRLRVLPDLLAARMREGPIE